MKSYKIKDLDSTYKFINRKNIWFNKNTQCKLLTNCGELGGIFKGQYLSRIDEELCPWEDFDIYNSKGEKIEVVT